MPHVVPNFGEKYRECFEEMGRMIAAPLENPEARPRATVYMEIAKERFKETSRCDKAIQAALKEYHEAMKRLDEAQREAESLRYPEEESYRAR